MHMKMYCFVFGFALFLKLYFSPLLRGSCWVLVGASQEDLECLMGAFWEPSDWLVPSIFS